MGIQAIAINELVEFWALQYIFICGQFMKKNIPICTIFNQFSFFIIIIIVYKCHSIAVHTYRFLERKRSPSIR